MTTLTQALRLSAITLAMFNIGSSYATEQNSDTEISVDEVITVTGSKQSLRMTPASATIITAEEIEKSPASDIAEALKNVPGLSNYTTTSGRNQIRIRGFSGDYTLVLLNGKRVSSTGALWRGGDFDYNSIPLNSIERIEVVRGPMSALYGSDAIGGVINIITKQASEEFLVTLNADYQSAESGEDGDQVRIGFNAIGQLNEDVAVRVSSEAFSRDAWYLDDTNEVTVPAIEEKQSENFNAALTWQVSKQQELEFDYSYNHDHRPHGLFDINVWEGNRLDYREQEITRDTLGIRHIGSWSWGETSISLTHENSEIDDYNSIYDDPKQRILKEKNTSLLANAYRTMGVHSLTAGIEVRRKKLTDAAAYVNTGTSTVDENALFIQDQIKLSKDLELTLGGRLDKHENFSGQFTPRAYLVYAINDTFTAKAGYSEAFKAPSQNQGNPDFRVISCRGFCFLDGNSELNPETSKTYTVSLDARQDDWFVNFTAYQTKAEDMIVRKLNFEPEMSAFWANEAEVDMDGFEIESSFNLTENLIAKANYSKVNTDSEQSDLVEYRPDYTANISVQWYATESLTASIESNMVGEQKHAVWLEDGPGFHELPSYNTFSAALSNEFTDNLTLRFGVKNINDKRLDNEDLLFNTHVLGRSFYVSGTYSFK